MTRTQRELIADNAFLRHQLVILERGSKRPPSRLADRWPLLGLARCTRTRGTTLRAIKPETLLRSTAMRFGSTGVARPAPTTDRGSAPDDRVDPRDGVRQPPVHGTTAVQIDQRTTPAGLRVEPPDEPGAPPLFLVFHLRQGPRTRRMRTTHQDAARGLVAAKIGTDRVMRSARHTAVVPQVAAAAGLARAAWRQAPSCGSLGTWRIRCWVWSFFHS